MKTQQRKEQEKARYEQGEEAAKRLLEKVEMVCLPIWLEEMRRQLEAAAAANDLEERKKNRLEDELRRLAVRGCRG